MINGLILQSLKINIINTDCVRVGTEWNYTDVYGPFHRLYYIHEGQASVLHHHQKFHLKPDTLHFVPGFARASYQCDSFMKHSYILFACELEGHFDLFSEMPLQFHTTGNQLDKDLFKRFLELNPNMTLEQNDPEKYNRTLQLHRAQNYCNDISMARFLESKSIVLQLLSRFLIDQTSIQPEHTENKIMRIEKAIRYIIEHAEQNITIKKLADISCITPDHFSKIFKQVMSASPIEYINRRRLQRAKLLLLTTDISVEQIAYTIGFASKSYFQRVFKRYEKTTPASYRRNASI